jgi:hypothetical protein
MEDAMAWTEITRAQYRRESLRYASDLTDDEWALIEPFMPGANKIGRPRTTDLRAVVEAILYMAATGCQWRQLPKDFPPYSTVQNYFYPWSREGLFAGVDWGTSAVMDQTRARAEAAGIDLVELEPLWDIDRPDDYDRAIAEGVL